MQQLQGLQTNQQQQQQHPADRYRNQLQSLRDMGFDDEQASLQALQQNHGNLNRAVDQLLMGPPPAPANTNTNAAPSSGSSSTNNNNNNNNDSSGNGNNNNNNND